ncbi:hypothetical protein [Kitasatospora mediocidica]|uniref:hypothetical protein n=1 Tax=Kitasatospora mediocidica TaxID=58352 RepID=UPI000564559D|nr:hypothetical protein [Kitasatospora mediocidica]
MDFLRETPSGATPDKYFGFDLTSREMRRGLLSFPDDQLVFAFKPKANNREVECRVQLSDELGDNLLNGTATVTIGPNQGCPSYLTFHHFGWEDEERLVPIDKCRYYVELVDSDDTVEVRIFGESLEPAEYAVYYGALSW